MKFKVTREDLKGLYLSNDDCPMARSIKRTLNTNDVRVFSCAVVHGQNHRIPQRYHDKAVDRGSGKLWGRIIGGFTFEIPTL